MGKGRLFAKAKARGLIGDGPMVCGRCGAEFSAAHMPVDRWGGVVCARCGSADVRHRPTRQERLRSFLIDYHTC
ncbi:MAG: hypothetical protein ABFD20_09925 [Anaerolineales bacterium]